MSYIWEDAYYTGGFEDPISVDAVGGATPWYMESPPAIAPDIAFSQVPTYISNDPVINTPDPFAYWDVDPLEVPPNAQQSQEDGSAQTGAWYQGASNAAGGFLGSFLKSYQNTPSIPSNPRGLQTVSQATPQPVPGQTFRTANAISPNNIAVYGIFAVVLVGIVLIARK
jgi:hypothetical protein